MNRDGNSYKTIVKRISAFGGVQIISILANLVRGKFAALLLGPAGMGMSSLFNNAATTIQQLAGLGLNLSLVKEVASSKNDEMRKRTILSLAVRMILLTSFLGAVVCIALSPFLSRWTFGSYEYTLSFIILSAGVAFSIAGLGYLALLQGLGEIKRLAYASLTGSLTGVFAGIPLYYLFGVKGIVPAIVAIYLAIFIFYYISFRRSVKYDDVPYLHSEHNAIAKRLISLGLLFMVGTLAGTATTYLMNMFIRHIGSIEDVGLFQAANSLTSQYVGVLLAALAMDYFPRLSEASDSDEDMREIANRQSEVVILIACPIILLVIILAPLGVHLLLSKEFISTVPLVRWFAIGVVAQVLGFPLGYYFLAKENKKAYFWLEVVATNVMWIILCTTLYPHMGLIGLGIGQVIKCAIDYVLAYFCCRKFYQFVYTRRAFTIMSTCAGLTVIAFLFSLSANSFLSQTIMWGIFIISLAFSLIMLKRNIAADKTRS